MTMALLASLPLPSLLEALLAVPDPRHRRGQRYSRASMLTPAVRAMLDVCLDFWSSAYQASDD
jgi:hypothetical protein